MAELTHDDRFTDEETAAASDTALDEPRMYRVILHNDHYTTMDFVVEVLTKVFQKTVMEATTIMLDVHEKGQGTCGIYTYDLAVTKTARVRQMAGMRDFPLKCSYEEA